MKAKSNSSLPKVVTNKNSTPTKPIKATQKEETKKLPAVVVNEKVIPVLPPEVVQLPVDPPAVETASIDIVANDLAVLATEEQSPIIPEPILPLAILSPEELIERQKRNEEFLFSCGKYNGKDTFGDPHKARILFDRGIDVDFVDSDGWSGKSNCQTSTGLPYLTTTYHSIILCGGRGSFSFGAMAS